MSSRQLWEGSDCAAWIRQVDGRSKLFILFCFALMVIAVDNPRLLFIIFSLTLLLHLVARTSFYKWQIMSILLLLGLWGSIISQALFFAQLPRTPLFVILAADQGWLGHLTGGIIVYREGIIYGAVQGLRSASMLVLGLLVCWSSDPRQLLQALCAWRLSPQLAFMSVTAIRFLPVLAAETGEIITALRIRSQESSGWRGILWNLPHIAHPLLARSLRRAQTLAASVTSRGFFLREQSRTNSRLPRAELAACILVACAAFILLVGKIIILLYKQGYYFGIFRNIYDWTRLYI